MIKTRNWSDRGKQVSFAVALTTELWSVSYLVDVADLGVEVFSEVSQQGDGALHAGRQAEEKRDDHSAQTSILWGSSVKQREEFHRKKG